MAYLIHMVNGVTLKELGVMNVAPKVLIVRVILVSDDCLPYISGFPGRSRTWYSPLPFRMESQCRLFKRKPNPRIGQRGPGIMILGLSSKIISMSSTYNSQSRSLELFQFLGVVDVITKAGIPVPIIRMYKPDGVEVLKQFEVTPSRDPTPTNPFVCHSSSYQAY